MRNIVFALLACAATPAGAESPGNVVARGAYLATVMDCAGCHMPRGSDGAPIFDAGLSGGTVGFEIPGMGIFYAPNLTPSETGLSNWTDEEIATAITGGLRPDGRILVPAMPWPAYAALNEADVAALVAYLRSLPAIDAPRLEPAADASVAAAPFYRAILP